MINAKLRSIHVILLFVCFTAVSQPVTYHKLFSAQFTTMEVLKMPDHGYLMAGNSGSGKGGMIRMDSSCNITSMKWYETATPLIYPQVRMNHILALPDGNFLTVGNVANTTTSNPDALLMKTDEFGNMLWSKKIYQSGYLISLYSASLMPDSGFVFCGTSSVPPLNTNVNFFAGRMDSAGNLLWSNSYSGGNNNCFGRIIRATPDGGCIFTGYYEDFSPFISHAALIKLDASGNVDWARKITPPVSGSFVSGSDVQVLQDGYLVYGISNPVFVTRTDTAGIPVWTKEYPNVQPSMGLIDYNGNLIIPAASGGYLLISGNDYFGYASRIDTMGNALWSSQFYMRLYNALETNNGEWHFTGGGPLFGVTQPHPDAGGPPDSEVGIIQSNAQGMPDISCMFSQQPAQNASAYTSSLYLPLVNPLGMLSSVTIIATNDTAVTVDTCVNVFGGFGEFGRPLPLVVSPNPGTGHFTLSLPEDKLWQMTVVNSLGQSICRRHVQGKEIQLHLIEEPDGIYFCRMTSSDGKQIYQGRILKSGK